MKSVKSLALIAALLLMALAMSAGSAFANTAANTQITNAATLTYTGGVPVKASVSVTVSLVPSTPNVTIDAGGQAAYIGTNTPSIKDTITVTATANGPGQYTVTPAIAAGSYTSTTGPSVNAAVSVSLGATTTTSNNGVNFLTVPAGATGNGKVNGIGNGATIVFTSNSHTHVITNVTVTDNTDGTWKISWTNQDIPSADIPTAGILVAEQYKFQVDVLPGTLVPADAGSNIVVPVSATVSGGGAADGKTIADAINTWTTTSSNPNVTLVKYVRNVKNQVTGTGGITIKIDGADNIYYTGGVTGKPGDILEYVLVANNTGTVDLAGSALSDTLPISFVNLANGVYSSNTKDIFYIDPTGAAYYFTAGTTGQASFNGSATPNLVVNVGNNATGSAGGVIPAGKSVTIAYQATIR